MLALWGPECLLAGLKIVKHFTSKNMLDKAVYISLSSTLTFLEMEEI